MRDPSVEAFLDDYPPRRRQVATILREIVLSAVPDALERVRPGWRLIGYDVPVGRRTVYFAFIWVESAHVHLGFEYGFAMDAPAHLLGGAALKRVRFVTMVTGDEISKPILTELVHEGLRVALMSRGERALRAMERGR